MKHKEFYGQVRFILGSNSRYVRLSDIDLEQPEVIKNRLKQIFAIKGCRYQF